MSTNPEFPENDHPENGDMTGFTNLTGPAAFKAQQKAADAARDDAAQAEAAAAMTADIQLAQGKIDQLEKAAAEAKDQLIRTVADMENLRKRSAREREDASKYAVSSFARDLLDVADTFRRAIDSIPADLKNEERIAPMIQGIEAMERALLACFDKNGIKKIEPLDEPFNPNFHEVMFEAPVPEKPAGAIIQVIEAGYILHDRLLRPARVGIAKAMGQDQAHNIDTQA